MGLALDCKVGLRDTGTTNAAGAFVFPYPAETVCTLRVNTGGASTTATIGRNAAQRSAVEIRVDTFAP